MAGFLPGDPSHHGMVESGPYNFSQDKPEEGGGRWYLSRKEIEENSPSRTDGIDLKKETYLRKSYCTFLQDLGMRLKVPQVTIATAIIFCHRFFLRQSHVKNDRRTIATVCMFLAGKVEETPRPLKDVILVSYEIIHKKDPAAVQRIKQKEVYEQQKELILLGERVVLATLGFDFNVHHPYKPLVEAIKKFKVAQNALAQVAWNFVNDGLRTSLCLQFKPHHIAAGAIFLAAKFLKVKLPSDGEKVWWQEFDVTPRQLEEVSNQMLELYEQNRMPPSHGSEVEGSADGGASHRAPTKTPTVNEESVSANGHVQASGGSTMKSGASMPSTTRPASDQSYVDNDSDLRRNSQNPSSDHASTDMRSVVSDQKVDDETKDHRLPERENVGEARNRSRYVEDQERNNNGKNETIEAGEWKNEEAQYKSGRNLNKEGPSLGQSPQDAIKKIDKDKVKAALEKRRKFRGDVARKMDLTDEDDLIERELEDGVELAVEDDKIKRERRQSWPKPSNRPDLEHPSYGKEHHEDIGDGQSSQGNEVENVEEGEFSQFESPKSNNTRKRKVGSSPNKHQLDGKQRHDYVPSYHHNHAERDHKRHGKEHHV
ncbi:Cyclin [Macleaya cordata]|uniref:Cyclin n=1 Tax=Macleaya cordata TaxID=56857 RepID=A0A200PRE9_MACCD|nr:Cyclin [Macleaya cordata]